MKLKTAKLPNFMKYGNIKVKKIKDGFFGVKFKKH